MLQISTDRREQTLDHDSDCEASAGVVGVVHVIPPVYVVYVDAIGVVPICWPGFNEAKPITAVLEARISADHDGIANVEIMIVAKIGMEAVV